MAARIPNNSGLILLKFISPIQRNIEMGIGGITWLTGSAPAKSPKIWAPWNSSLSHSYGEAHVLMSQDRILMTATTFQAGGCRKQRERHQRVFANFILRKVHRSCHVTLVLIAHWAQLSHMATNYRRVWKNHMGESICIPDHHMLKMISL